MEEIPLNERMASFLSPHQSSLFSTRFPYSLNLCRFYKLFIMKIILFLIINFLLYCHPKAMPLETPLPKTNGKLEYFIKGTEVNFREGPGKNYRVIRRFENGERVYPVGMDAVNSDWKEGNGWIKLMTEKRESGWVHSEYVSAKFLGIKSGIFLFSYYLKPEKKNILDLAAKISDNTVAVGKNNLRDYLKGETPIEMSAYDWNGNCLGKYNTIGIKDYGYNNRELKIPQKYASEARIVTDFFSETKNQNFVRQLNIDSADVQKILSLYKNNKKVYGCKHDKAFCEFFEINIYSNKYIYFLINEKQAENSSTYPSHFGIYIFENGEPKNLMNRTRRMEHETFQALTDLDNDGVFELWTSTSGYEWGNNNFYLWDEKFILQVSKCGSMPGPTYFQCDPNGLSTDTNRL